jgi:hypothetical protein
MKALLIINPITSFKHDLVKSLKALTVSPANLMQRLPSGD